MVLDVITLVLFFYGFWVGYTRGIITTIFSYASILIGVVAAIKFAPILTNIVTQLSGVDHPLLFIVGVVGAFFVCMFVIRLVGKGIVEGLEFANINFINQILGGVLSGLSFLLVFSYLLWFGDQSRMINESLKNESKTYAYVSLLPEKAKSFAVVVLPFVGTMWNESLDFFDKAQRLGIERIDKKPDIYDIEEGDPAALPSEAAPEPQPRESQEEPRENGSRRGTSN